MLFRAFSSAVAVVGLLAAVLVASSAPTDPGDRTATAVAHAATVRHAAARDVSPPLGVVGSGQWSVGCEKAVESLPSLPTAH